MVGQSDFVTFALYFTRVPFRVIMHVGHSTQPGAHDVNWSCFKRNEKANFFETKKHLELKT